MTYTVLLVLQAAPRPYLKTLWKKGEEVVSAHVIESSQIHHFLGRCAIQRYCFITCTVSTVFRKGWAFWPCNSEWGKEEISGEFWAVDFLDTYDFEALKFRNLQQYPPFKSVLLTDVDSLSLLGLLAPGNPLVAPSHCAAQGILVLDSDWEF